MSDRTAHMLAQLQTGFPIDSKRLKELEESLTLSLQSARLFGAKHGVPGEWSTNWNGYWERVGQISRRIGGLMSKMDGCFATSEPDRLKTALDAWETIQLEDAKLVETLGRIRTQVGGFNEDVRKEWSPLAHLIKSHLEAIRSCAQALRVKLELLKQYSNEEADRLVKDILSRLPNRAPGDKAEAETFLAEYRKAYNELEKERHRYGGFMDIVKALWMWVETEDERIDKNRSHELDCE